MRRVRFLDIGISPLPVLPALASMAGAGTVHMEECNKYPQSVSLKRKILRDSSLEFSLCGNLERKRGAKRRRSPGPQSAGMENVAGSYWGGWRV
jgi:hypothetical protein